VVLGLIGVGLLAAVSRRRQGPSRRATTATAA
jgi:hypothetical protein